MTQPAVPYRAVVEQIPAYVPGARSPQADVHLLASNENPFPPLPSVVAAVHDAASRLHRYPDMFAVELTERLAARHGVDAAGIVAGTGSVAVLAYALQAFCDAGDEVVFAWRSFEAYPIVVRLQGAVPVRVPVTTDGRHDVAAMVAAVTDRTKAVLLCSPNNPTGPALTHAEVTTVLEAVPSSVLVVLDEAYVEFVRAPDAVDSAALLAAHPNLVVLRTFSKAFGLAGLRVGYAVTAPAIARALRAAATPFGVNHLAQVAAVASLEAEAELAARVDAVVGERDRVLAALRAQGWAVPDAQGNFVWLPTGARTSELAAAAREAGVLLRPFAGEGIRVSIGAPEANDAVLSLTAGWWDGAAG